MRKLKYFLIGFTLVVPLLTYNARAEENPCVKPRNDCMCDVTSWASVMWDYQVDRAMKSTLRYMLKDEEGRGMVSHFLRETRCQFMKETVDYYSKWHCEKDGEPGPHYRNAIESQAESQMDDYLRFFVIQLDVENPAWDRGCSKNMLKEHGLRKKK